MKYRSIVISGPIASGSTTAAKMLSKLLKIPYKSAGDFFRKYMLENKIPLPQKEKIPDEVEKTIDSELTLLAKSKKPIIIDGLYIGYFTRNMPHVFKVLLTCDEKERIKRAILRTHTHKETEEDIKRRGKAHDKKFRKLYANEDFQNPEFFDLVVNTTSTSPEVVASTIVNKFKG